MKINPANERLKYRYFDYLRETRSLGEHVIDQVAKALDRFEEHTVRRPFREYRTEQAISFKKALAKLNARRSGERLSKATVTSTLHALRGFFRWLAEQKGFHRIRSTDADYFRPLRSDEAIARARRPASVPTIDQVRALIKAIPNSSTVDRRGGALIALIMLTGARDDAIASARLKHLNVAEQLLFQDPREMRTKFRSTISTWFFPVGDDLVTLVAEWKAELETTRGFGPDDPLFPRTEVSFGPDGSVLQPELGQQCWANADPVRKLFKEACEAAGLPYFNPHSLRHTLGELLYDYCTTPEQAKAWSQNLGHKDVLTTFTSYGTLPGHRQRDVIRSMRPLP
jgi:integrase